MLTGARHGLRPATIGAWAESACTAVPAVDYKATASTTAPTGTGAAGGSGALGAVARTPYACSPGA